MPSVTSHVTILAVGVEQYSGGEYLKGPGVDLENLRALLVEDPRTALYGPTQFIEMLNPTVSQLREAINNYAMARSARGDILVFYFSGHGVPIGSNDFGFCTAETLWHPLEDMVLPMSVLRFSDVLQTLLVGSVTPVFIIDACYSGMAARSLAISSSQLVANMRREVQKENASNFGLLCSCASHQTTSDTATGGIFSHYLIDIAGRGVPNSRRKVPRLSLHDIFPELSARVGSYTGDSAPRLYLGETLPEFPLVKNVLYKPQREPFTPYMMGIIRALWNDGDERQLTIKQIDMHCGKGAYGNHSKLSYGPWRLVEDVPGTKKKRRLTDRGRAFAQGKLKIPKAIVKDPDTGEYAPEDNTAYVDIFSI